MGTWVTLGIAATIFGLLLWGSIVLVRQQNFKIVERLGKFKKVCDAGLQFKLPVFDRIAHDNTYRIEQLDMTIETKTEDNVFVYLKVAIQYCIEKAYESYYKLTDPEEQIKAYVSDIVRGRVPVMRLDDVFKDKDGLALAIKEHLAEKMDDFGYRILQTLVLDVEPDKNVKSAMNEINAATRLRIAASEKGEADKPSWMLGLSEDEPQGTLPA